MSDADRLATVEAMVKEMKPKVDTVYDWVLKRQGANNVIRTALSPLIPRLWDIIFAGLLLLLIATR